MNKICLLCVISLFGKDMEAITFTNDFSYDSDEVDDFPSPNMMLALSSSAYFPDDFDTISASGEMKCRINVVATCNGICETIEICDVVMSTIDAAAYINYALDLVVKKLLPGAGGRLA